MSLRESLVCMYERTYTECVGFEWDRAKARTNLRKHRIDFADVGGVFEDPQALTMSDPHPGEERFVTLGLDAFRRLLVVCWTVRGEHIRIILGAARNTSRTSCVHRGDLGCARNTTFRKPNADL